MQWAAEKYDAFQREHQFRYGKELISTLETFTPLTGKSLLDLGCGTGDLTLLLKQKAGDRGHVTAIDRDRGMLEALRKKTHAARLEIHESELTTWLASTAEIYDVIYSNAVLHWLASYAQFAGVLDAAARRTASHGYLAFRFSLEGNAKEAKDFLEEQLRAYAGDGKLKLQRSVFGYRQCLSHLHKAGFEVRYSEEITDYPFSDMQTDFGWLIGSQPLLKFMREQELPGFERYLRDRWERRPIKVKNHHGIFIARKP